MGRKGVVAGESNSGLDLHLDGGSGMKPSALSSQLPCLVRHKRHTQLLVDGEPYIMLAGEVHNSSSSSLAYMEPIWDELAGMHCNTALVPVSWELLEPEEGRFDFTLVDGLLAGARARRLRLVLLWFGTWKNALSTYVPAWVKTDTVRFPRVQLQPGVNTRSLSCFSAAGCQADAAAFAALMRHLRQTDPEHTVIMVQVENETGVLGGTRDRAPVAEAAFASPVPQRLLTYLDEYYDTLLPEVKQAWEQAGRRTSGNWAEVFGREADEFFMAWHIARYVDQVAAAGKAELPLPMFVNAWLVQFDGQTPGEYPSGGPVHRVLDIWRAAAPHIDFLAPDIYLEDFRAVCAQYHRSSNPLFIPEARATSLAAANAFYALAQHDAIGFAPFGIDGAPGAAHIRTAYAFLAPLLPLIARHQGTGTMAGFVQQGEEMHHALDLGDYHLHIRYQPRKPEEPPAHGLAIALTPGEYLIGGAGFSVEFCHRFYPAAQVDYLAVEEGTYQGDAWVPGRRLNGDELGVRLNAQPAWRRVKLYTY
jgi:hypothetical protein